MRRRLLPLLLVPLLLLAACGSDGGDDAAAAPDEASAESGPITIEHKYGTTEIPETPERVVSVGFSEQDTILALGVVPVGIRDWYGDQPQATWPWAHDLLDGAEPKVLGSGELDFEEIASLNPDVILGVTSGMTEEDYDTLSAIAPTVPQSGDYVDYGMPWDEAALTIGKALGKEAEAEELVDGVKDQIAELAAEHPEFKGKQASVSYVMDEANIGAYGPDDIRTQLLLDLGFELADGIAEKAGDEFYSQFSWEEIGLIDRDVIVWISGDDAVAKQIQDHPLRQQTTAAKEGREVFLDFEEAGAASFASVLSLPKLFETYIPKLAAAVDGDPATVVPE